MSVSGFQGCFYGAGDGITRFLLYEEVKCSEELATCLCDLREREKKKERMQGWIKGNKKQKEDRNKEKMNRKNKRGSK